MFTVSLTIPDIDADSPQEAADIFRQAMPEYSTLDLSYEVEDRGGRITLVDSAPGENRYLVPQPFRDLLTLAQGVDVFQDDYRMEVVLRACEAILEGSGK